MTTTKILAAALLLTGAASTRARCAEPGKAQIRAILLEEAQRPAQAPAPGSTLWDLTEAAVYKTRKARQVYEDAKDWSTGIDRDNGEWARQERRIARLESAYRELMSPGMKALGTSFTSIRGVATDTDLLLQEREFYARLVLPDGPNAAFTGEPKKEGIKALRLWREQAEGDSAKAEEVFEKALARIQARDKARDLPYPDYLEGLIVSAEEALEKTAAAGLSLAQAQADFTGKDGLYGRSIAAVEKYGGPDGKDSYRAADHDAAVNLSNEAKRRLTVLEYTMASQIEETRTIDYLLGRFGKL